MLRLTVPVRDVISHVLLPVSEQIIEKLLTDLGLKDVFGNKVYLNSDSTGSSTSTNTDNNPKLKENRITANMTYNLNPLAVKWPTGTFNSVLGGPNFLNNEHEKIPTFLDVRTQTTLTEQESPTNIELAVTMNFTDRVLATEAVNRIVTMYADGEKITVGDFAYNYPIPRQIYTIIYGLYKHIDNEIVDLTADNIEYYYGYTLVGPDVVLTEDNAPTYVDTTQEIKKPDFVKYLDRFSGGRISYNVNRHDLSGKKEIVGKKNNAQVVMQIDFEEGKSEVEATNQSTDLYKVAFTITAQFGRCVMSSLSYPIIVQNQVVSEELVSTDPRKSFRDPREDHPYFSWNYYKRLTEENRVVAPETVNIPWYDDWKPRQNSPLRQFKYREFLTIAFTLDNVGVEGGTTSIDIANDLPFPLIPEVLDKYALYGSDCLGYDKPFHITAYVNDVQIDSSELTFDGSVLTISRQDINPVYRLVLAEYIGVPYGNISTLRVINYDIIAKRQ